MQSEIAVKLLQWQNVRVSIQRMMTFICNLSIGFSLEIQVTLLKKKIYQNCKRWTQLAIEAAQETESSDGADLNSTVWRFFLFIGSIVWKFHFNLQSINQPSGLRDDPFEPVDSIKEMIPIKLLSPILISVSVSVSVSVLVLVLVLLMCQLAVFDLDCFLSLTGKWKRWLLRFGPAMKPKRERNKRRIAGQTCGKWMIPLNRAAATSFSLGNGSPHRPRCDEMRWFY